MLLCKTLETIRVIAGTVNNFISIIEFQAFSLRFMRLRKDDTIFHEMKFLKQHLLAFLVFIPSVS